MAVELMNFGFGCGVVSRALRVLGVAFLLDGIAAGRLCYGICRHLEPMYAALRDALPSSDRRLCGGSGLDERFQGCSLVAKHCRSAITLAMLGLQLRVGPDQLLSVASLGARLRPWRARTKALAPGRIHWKKARSRSATRAEQGGGP